MIKKSPAGGESRLVAGSTAPVGKKPKKLFAVSFFTAWCKQCGLCTPFCPKKIITTDARGYPRITAADSLLVINSTLVEQSPTSWVIGVLSRQVSLEHPTAALLARIPPDSRKRTKWRLTWGLKKVK